MTNETEVQADENAPSAEQPNTITENLAAVGQMIVGGIETIGGIITGDPITRAEGDFNTGAGAIHQDSNRILTHLEQEQETVKDSEDLSRNNA